MIRIPKEVADGIRKLKNKGFKAYVVGGSVRDSLLGIKPYDWDIITDASLEDMIGLFPDGKILSKDLNVIRRKIKINNKEAQLDIARFREEHSTDEKGRPIDYNFVDDVNKDLKRRDFTINAMADDGMKLVDIFDGKKDLEDGLIRVIGDGDKRFTQDPIRMMRALRFMATLGFSIEANTYESIKTNSHKLNGYSQDKIRIELLKLARGNYLSQTVKSIFDTGLNESIFGKDTGGFRVKKRGLYLRFIRNIDKSDATPLVKLALIYSLIGAKKGREAIDLLNYDKVTKQKLYDTLFLTKQISLIRKSSDLKRFLNSYGYERYEFLQEVMEEKSFIYGGSNSRNSRRNRLYDNILSKKEAVLVDELAIDGDEILNLKYDLDGKEIGQILECLLMEVHKYPFKNNRGSLMSLAEKYAKSSFKRKIRLSKFYKRLFYN